MRYFAIVILSIFFFQCSQSQNCGSETSANPTVGFFITTTEDNTFTISNLTIYGIHNDTSITDSIVTNEEKSNIELPLNSNVDSTSYIIAIGDKPVIDTLTIFYTKDLYSRSTECEFVMNFNITDIQFTTDTLSNVIIQDPIVEDLEKTSTTDETDPFYHLKFYF